MQWKQYFHQGSKQSKGPMAHLFCWKQGKYRQLRHNNRSAAYYVTINCGSKYELNA